MFDVVVGVGWRSLDRCVDAEAVLGRNGAHDLLRSQVLSLRPAEHGLELAVAYDTVRTNIPLPDAYAPAYDGKPQSFLACAQSFGLTILDDRDSGGVGGHFDELPMPSGGAARIVEVESEGTQHATLLIKDGH